MQPDAFEVLEKAVRHCTEGSEEYLRASNIIVVLIDRADTGSSPSTAVLLKMLHFNLEKLCRLSQKHQGRKYYEAACLRLLDELRKRREQLGDFQVPAGI